MSVTINNKEYKHDNDFLESKKDLIVLTSDGRAIKVDSKLLKETSPVLEAQLSHLHLDHSSDAVKLHIKALQDDTIDFTNMTYKTFKETLEMCLKYVTKHEGLGLLGQINEEKGVIGHFGAEKGFELFCLMPHFNDMLTSCRIIKEVGPEATQDKNDKYGDFWDPLLWTKDTMKELRGDWACAYILAHKSTAHPYGTRDYWDDVSRRFLLMLVV
ncbi:uncharacterized protein I303_102574 [Kwoniella dejecticola CBS 10117]|uniref:BTB domain-containing protein n=1 Tax=Kwoniella dejecticola CBS 10117 TaxID=1296121 RepID=A0A1A6A946_9TREE|nr:uncharacterized protein I303_02588 [Kwoniella dejecticola CBS 10117]OBR86580.1 hypothetical protein I303_02588 [Kwoniella dejecticola CBS 10117]